MMHRPNAAVQQPAPTHPPAHPPVAAVPPTSSGRSLPPDESRIVQSMRRKYEKLEQVGEGVYGTVYMAKDCSDGSIVALKKIRLEEEEEGIPATAIREMALLQSLDHKNVVALHDLICSTKHVYLVFEFLDTDLRNFMKSNKIIGGNRLKSFAYQLINGVAYCHAHRMLHRDLKPQNILISRKDMTLKIADFGLARMFGLPVKDYTHEVVTLWYRAPEILLGTRKYGPPVDVWSVGCVFAEMATGAPLFPGDSEIGTIFKIFKTMGSPTVQVWPDLARMSEWKSTFPKWRKGCFRQVVMRSDLGNDGIDLLNSFLHYDPKHRVSCADATKHPFLDSVDKTPFAFM